jgi:predicted phosphodiesterase
LSTKLEKIVVFSDIHGTVPIGWSEKIEKFIRPHWQETDMVIFNGDTINWTSNYQQNDTEAVVEHIQKICSEDSVTPLILAGNADFLISDEHFFYHEDSQTFVFHGEVVFPEVSPWRLEHKLLNKRYCDFLKDNSHKFDSELDLKFAASKHVINIYEFDDSFQKKLYYRFPWIINPVSWFNLLKVWKTFPKRTAEFAKCYYPDVKHVVVGHFHKAGIWNIDGIEVICTGAFRKFSAPLMVSIEGTNVEYQNIKKGKKNRT